MKFSHSDALTPSVTRRLQLSLSDNYKMSKTERYQNLYKQLESLVSGENDQIANMANMAAMIHETFGFWWTGFYIVKGEQLVLGVLAGANGLIENRLIFSFRVEIYHELGFEFALCDRIERIVNRTGGSGVNCLLGHKPHRKRDNQGQP